MPKKVPPDSLELRLLGTFRAFVNDQPVNERLWKRRKNKLLVKLLALQPFHQLHREQVMESLWPEEDPDSAAKSLHRTIHEARHALEPHLSSPADSHFISIRDEQILLRAPGKLQVDAADFEQQAREALKNGCRQRYEAALACYEGDLLIEDLYEDWTAFPRERLRELYRDLSVRLAELLEVQGEYSEAIEHLKRVITRDLTDEEAHRALMRLYALAGNRNKAILQYRLCRETVRKDLEADPEQCTIQLYQQILSGHVQPFVPTERRATPSFHQLTFRRGWLQAARFAPGEHSIFLSAAWEGAPLELFSVPLESAESKPLNIAGAGIHAISSTAELAVSLRHRFLRGYTSCGTLARIKVNGRMVDGGSAGKLPDTVQWADWSPDGRSLAIVRDVAGRNHLEFPAGQVLYETSGWISHPRFSPAGDAIAFIDHPALDDDGGEIAIVNFEGHKETLSSGWISAQGLAWSSAGTEVWFTASKTGNSRALYAVNLSQQERLVYQGIGSLTLHDISAAGQVLITREQTRLGIICRAGSETHERDLSWHDWSLARDLSKDGETLLFTEAGEGSGATYSVYLRKTNGSSAIRLGEGSALALSPDKEWALAKLTTPSPQLALLPTAGGELKLIERAALSYQPWACWFADGERILFAANEPNRGTRLYVQRIAGGATQCITPRIEGLELTSPHALSPDGKTVAALGPDQKLYLYPVAGGVPQIVTGAVSGDVPVRWSADAGSLFVRQRGEVPSVIYQLDLQSGSKQLWGELMPADKAGVREILRVLFTPDGQSYAYTYTRELSELYLVSGLR
ncbi:MAG: BTAD domain-containing putative transcriptional regulator [Pyrinomonadaceae bacterium]